MEKSKIEWCDSTWNPVSGCYHPCPYCYARSTANRFKGCDCAAGGETDENVVYLKERLTVTSKDGVVRNAAYPFGFTPTFHEYRLNDPLTKGFGKTIFVCSMADLFGDWVPDEWIKKVFDACKAASGHRYLFLTKNPARYIRLYEAGLLPAGDEFWYGSTTTERDVPMFWSDEHHTFVSIEPILGPLGNPKKDIIEPMDWFILGAETGNRKDKVVPKREWIEGVVEQAKSLGKPVFMKDSMKPIWGDDIITEFPWSE